MPSRSRGLAEAAATEGLPLGVPGGQCLEVFLDITRGPFWRKGNEPPYQNDNIHFGSRNVETGPGELDKSRLL